MLFLFNVWKIFERIKCVLAPFFPTYKHIEMALKKVCLLLFFLSPSVYVSRSVRLPTSIFLNSSHRPLMWAFAGAQNNRTDIHRQSQRNWTNVFEQRMLKRIFFQRSPFAHVFSIPNAGHSHSSKDFLFILSSDG